MSQLDQVITNKVAQSHIMKNHIPRGFKFENLELIFITSYWYRYHNNEQIIKKIFSIHFCFIVFLCCVVHSFTEVFPLILDILFYYKN